MILKPIFFKCHPLPFS